MSTTSNTLFLESALTSRNPFITTEEVKSWMKEQNERVKVDIRKTSFAKLEKWIFKDDKLVHETGKFFTIEGIRVKTNWSEVSEWEQPIINQPEIGYLGFIVKPIGGVLYFLMQAKIEPGNVNYVQLSPTLQATKSNYTRAHKGNAPDYLEYFQKVKPENVLLDQLQSEQGGRFLKKRNRNIIIQVDDDIEVKENFVWLTLAQIKDLMRQNNLVNMDSRTVVSGIPFLSNDSLKSSSNKFLSSYLCHDENALNTFSSIVSFITRMKCFYELEIESIDLKKVKDWVITDSEILHRDKKYFKVIATEVEISSREVIKWFQPMIEPAQEGICAFVCKEINGILHFAVQAKLECGNFDIIELAPTVQCLTGNFTNNLSRKSLPFLDYVLTADKQKVIYDTYQSEEGGRFFKEQNRNMIVMAGEEVSEELPENYIWMTLNQLQQFIQFNNYINIQARSLIAAMSFSN